MNDRPASLAILNAATGDWSIFSRLVEIHNKEPGVLPRILRAHSEAGFHREHQGGAGDMDIRQHLDEALNRLLLIELAIESGCLEAQEFTPPGNLIALLSLDVFLRYINSYLYFGVRLLMGRYFDPAAPAKSPGPDCNQVPLPLFAPPVPPDLDEISRDDAILAYLNLPVADTVAVALAFLDDFSDPNHERSAYDFSDPSVPHERTIYELWLRGLWHDRDNRPGAESRFLVITAGITKWATDRVRFYKTLEGSDAGEDPAWIARNPLSARFAVCDLYWFARLLGADMSTSGRVTYTHKSWLEQIAGQSEYRGDHTLAKQLREAGVILRGVFDFATDLVQNAIEITEDAVRQALEPASCAPFESPAAVNWRSALDEELDEIDRQQYLRTFEGHEKPFQSVPPPKEQRRWSRRIRTGEYPGHEVTGIALSGGGIRSATFALGVLQGLKELDLLKHIDYLSTVSGGGYIGAWLVGGVQRASHFLGRQTNWDDSIGHLRRHSKYLAPNTGVLSADSWTMGGIWLRNAVLIQFMAIAWLLCVLAVCVFGKAGFDGVNNNPALFGWTGEWTARILVVGSVVWIAAAVQRNLRTGRTSVSGEETFSEAQVQTRLVIPAWIGAFLTSALLWAEATGQSTVTAFIGVDTYSGLLRTAYRPWVVVLTAMLAGFIVLGFTTLTKSKPLAPLFASIAVLGLYLQLCGVMLLFRGWAQDPAVNSWYAFITGPTLVLTSVTLSVVLFIGLCGKSTEDQTREWWTRMGSWLAIYGTGYLVLAVSAVLGPLWVLILFQTWTLKWGAIGSFLGTVIGGLMTGKSSKTSGAASGWMEYLARAGAILFIAGGLFGVATLLHFLLVNVFTDYTPSRQFYWESMNSISPWLTLTAVVAALALGLLLSWRIELNVFGLNYFYRNRLVRCYLGATRWRPGMRKPNRFTGFDEDDEIDLNNLRHNGQNPCQRPFRGPFPIVNCTLNLGGSADLSVHTRKSASFSMTPLRCGANRAQVGFAPTREFSGGVKLGQAISVSGAAASPNMGYNTSALVSFLLTMFNVRLGWWFPNPSGLQWKNQGLPWGGFFYLIRELFGYANEKSAFLNVSDGGHFENLGIYELVRRRAKVIIAADGECDENLNFGSLGNLVRICETDLGAKIDIDVNSIRKDKDTGLSRAHCAVGKITYSNGSEGWLIYLKASILGDEDVGIAQYRAVHPSFPHQSTADQFFSEDQFDAYRKLGRHIVQHSFRGTNPGQQLTTIAQRLYDTWTPRRFTTESFLAHSRTLDAIWERLRQSENLFSLLDELTADQAFPPKGTDPTPEELCACLELLQLMEDVFLDLRLGDYWDHPDNRGWAMLFSAWAKSSTFHAAWHKVRRTFGIRFEYFCDERLGLEKENPVARV